jgi:hypothetical protein
LLNKLATDKKVFRDYVIAVIENAASGNKLSRKIKSKSPLEN